MKKSKIEIGQCYEKADHIYEVIEKAGSDYGPDGLWKTKNTLHKNIVFFKTSDLLKMRKPFQNYG